jgi:hypothetical protein
MAKRTTAKRKRQSATEIDRVLSDGPLRRSPRTPPLPGMENARVRSLDEIAASIADCREQINELRGTAAGLEQRALKLMKKHNKTVWKHDGVELVLVPGDERLRVRLIKGGGDAEVETGDSDDVPEEQDEGSEDGETLADA